MKTTRPRRLVTAARLAARRGMSLVEVIVAMLILTAVILVLGGFSAKFAQANGQAHLIITANEIAASRMDEIRTQPTYASLDLLKAAGDTVKADFTSFIRKTDIKRIGGGITDTLDYKLFTVTVTHPSLKKVVKKTTAMAAF
jgi:prepilin-type N-terminal cleavage/methylation domain-containing protein